MDIDLAGVQFSEEVVVAWKEMAQRIVPLILESGIDPKNIPDEQGRVSADGTLTVFISLPNGIRVSMEVPKEHWSYRQ